VVRRRVRVHGAVPLQDFRFLLVHPALQCARPLAAASARPGGRIERRRWRGEP
jgi:hypothetical protein